VRRLAASADAGAFGETTKPRKPLTDWQARRIGLALGESLHLGESEGKGYGVFASEDLPANKVLLDERPYLMPPPLLANETKQDVYTLFYALMSGSQEEADGPLGWLFDALCCHHMTLGPKEDILRTVFPVVRQLAESKLGPDSGISSLSDDKLLEVHQTIRTNMQGSGGLYIGCAMFNHSCSPNAVAANKGQSDANYSVMSLVDIKEGEEVTIPYIDFSRPVIDRQSALQAMYGFRCGCAKCNNELENINILGGKAWTGSSGTL